LELVDRAPSLTEYKLAAAREQCDLSATEGSLAFLKRAAVVLRELSPVEAEVYIRKIASETRVSEGAIRREVFGEDGRSSAPPSARSASARHAENASESADISDIERNFIRLILLSGAYIDRIKPYEKAFSSPAAFRIYAAVTALCADDGEVDMRKLEDALTGPDRALLIDIRENVPVPDADEILFNKCVSAFCLSALTDRQNEIIRMLTVLNDEENREKVEALTKESINIQREIEEIKGR
jgi:DNA primase